MPKLPWEDQFMESIPAIVAGGETEERARKLLTDYIRLARTTAMPEALDFEQHPDLAATASPYLRRDEEIHDLRLVASPRDMAESEPIKRELARLNIRSFKEAKERQRQGQILVLFPEGTRSRDGRRVAGLLPQEMRGAYARTA
jgi:hypothetical protein